MRKGQLYAVSVVVVLILAVVAYQRVHRKWWGPFVGWPIAPASLTTVNRSSRGASVEEAKSWALKHASSMVDMIVAYPSSAAAGTAPAFVWGVIPSGGAETTADANWQTWIYSVADPSLAK